MMKGFILGIVTAILVIGFAALVANAAEVTVSVDVEENEIVEEYFDEFTEGVYDFFESLEER